MTSRWYRLWIRRAAVPHPGQRLESAQWCRVSCTSALVRSACSTIKPGGTSDEDRSWRMALAPFAKPTPEAIHRHQKCDRAKIACRSTSLLTYVICTAISDVLAGEFGTYIAWELIQINRKSLLTEMRVSIGTVPVRLKGRHMKEVFAIGMFVAFASSAVSAATLQGSFFGTFSCSPRPTSGGKQISNFLINDNKVKLIETEWVGNSPWFIGQYFGTYNLNTRTFSLPNFKTLAAAPGVYTSSITGTLSADGNIVRYRWNGLSCSEFVGTRMKVN